MGKLIWLLLGGALAGGFVYYLDRKRDEGWRSRTSDQLTHVGDQVRDHSERAIHEVKARAEQLGEVKDELIGDASAHGRRAARAVPNKR